MQPRHMNYYKMWMFLIVGLLMLTTPVFAQESGTTDPLPLSEHLIVLEFNTQNASKPNFEMLTDGRAIFTITASGPVAGDLGGTVTLNISQIVNIPELPLDSLAVTFTIETADGRIEGASDLVSNGSGQILSVTGVYADLFLAEVFLNGQIHGGTGSTETMIISPR